MGFVAVSHNVRHQVLDDGRDAWENRRDGVVEQLRSVSPDILGLQESTGRQQRDIERALDGYEWDGVADEPGSGEHNPVGVGRRFVHRDGHTEWLSATPEERSVGWDGAYPRVLTRVSLEVLAADGVERSLQDARTVAATVDGPATTVTDFEALNPDRRSACVPEPSN